MKLRSKKTSFAQEINIVEKVAAAACTGMTELAAGGGDQYVRLSEVEMTIDKTSQEFENKKIPD